MARALATWLCVSVFLLAGCQRAQVAEAPRAPGAPVEAPSLEGARIYTIDHATSRVDILVYRGGPMARLGHNHVMTARNVTGRAWVREDVSRSGFELAFKVAELVVDDREARLAAGSDFPPEIPDKDKAGTQANMLRAEVLDAERYPEVTLRSVRVTGQLPDLTFTTAMTLKDVTREIDVPARVTLVADRLQATGEFTLRQTDFGIKPFSVAMGAVQVQDELRIRFDLNAAVTPNL